MKRFWIPALLVALLCGCAGTQAVTTDEAFSKYDRQCREHSRDMYAEDSAQRRYDECMHLHLGTQMKPAEDDPHLTDVD